MSLIKRLFGVREDRAALRPLYAAIIAEARDPAWYGSAGVPDTIDGRFDMIATILALVLLRLEREGDAARLPSALLTETFVDDMDGQLREIGIGDLVVGKHIGKMMGALGGRLGAYRDAFVPGGDLPAAIARNLYRGEPPSDDAVAFAATALRALETDIATVSLSDLWTGALRR